MASMGLPSITFQDSPRDTTAADEAYEQAVATLPQPSLCVRRHCLGISATLPALT
jgi:hypothetical protein